MKECPIQQRSVETAPMGMVRLLMPSEGRIFMLMDGPISTCIAMG